jgi:hypothetical protein
MAELLRQPKPAGKKVSKKRGRRKGGTPDETPFPRSHSEGVLWPLHKADSLSEAEWQRFEEGLRTFGIDVKLYPNIAALKPEAEKAPGQKAAKRPRARKAVDTKTDKKRQGK